MYNNKSIIKVINKKYFLNEFLYIMKTFNDSYEVLIIDVLNNRVYIEDNYPFSLINESKIKEYGKKEFLDELPSEIKKLLTDNFIEIFNEISQYDEQKSLF